MPLPKTNATLGITLLLAPALVVLVYVIAWLHFAPDQPRSWGLPRELASYVAASYAAPVLSTFVGARDALSKLLEGKDAAKKVPGFWLYYGLSMAGAVLAIAALLYSASWQPEDTGKWLIGFAAGAWGLTIGWTFQTRLAKFAPQASSGKI